MGRTVDYFWNTLTDLGDEVGARKAYDGVKDVEAELKFVMLRGNHYDRNKFGTRGVYVLGKGIKDFGHDGIKPAIFYVGMSVESTTFSCRRDRRDVEAMRKEDMQRITLVANGESYSA